MRRRAVVRVHDARRHDGSRAGARDGDLPMSGGAAEPLELGFGDARVHLRQDDRRRSVDGDRRRPNALDRPGDFVVSLGCSTEPYTGNGFLVSQQLAPTAQLEKRRTPRRPQRAPKQGAAAGDLCSSVPDCQPQTEPTFSLGGWKSTTKRYACKTPYPYAWTMTWAQTGRPSVSAIGAIFAVDPGEMDVLLTNWNPFATDDVTITTACSKQNSFGGDCGAIQGDPGCPQVPGSQHIYCTKGPITVCFSTYEERCQPSNQLYSCTIDVIIPWCQPCPG